MKKLIAILLAALMVACFAACGATEDPTEPASDEIVTDLVTDSNVTDGNATTDDVTEEITEEATEEIPADDSAAVAALSAVWNEVVADEALIAAFGATSSEEIAGYFMAPAAFDMSDLESVSATFQISADNAANVEEIAYVMHMMNANNLTAAAYVLAEGTDSVDFANSLKDDIAAAQWICGAPEQVVIAEVEGAVIAAFGGADVITAFNTVLAANGTVLVNDMIG
ncbi:MAG: hypothetical protein IJA31_03835 [Clostridia bacterium]|nr:hypothetical protein [Clostridia bacterium]